MREAVYARDLRVSRGGREVLGGLAFTIAGGTLTGLIGPSGSGKTTLMRAIVGVQRNVAGTLRVAGEPAGSPPLRARVAYLPQAPSIYADLTVTENLRYFARLLHTGGHAVDDALAAVRLTGHAGRVVRSLSGGEQARVSLASALLGDPQVLVLDEPTVGLDPVLRQDLWSTFGHLAAQGATLIVSSHVMDEAERCDRVMLLRDGRLLADDTPDHIRADTGQSRLEDAFLALVRNEHGTPCNATPATATPVLQQLRHDRRTTALLLVVPVMLLTLVRYAINADNAAYQRFGQPLLGVFPLVSMFLVTSIAMLRERTSGTLERLLTTPISKLDLLAGYGIAFAAVAAVQACLLCTVAIGLLDLHIAGSVPMAVVLAVANAVLGMAMGLFLSAFVSTEFQAVQFMPAFLLPQLLLCGIAVPREHMAAPLRWLSDVLPMTYAYKGFDAIRTSKGIPGTAVVDLIVVVGMAIAALALGAATLRRRTE